MSDGQKSIVPWIALAISLFSAVVAGFSAANSLRAAVASERSAAVAESSLVLQQSLLTTSFSCHYSHGLTAPAGTDGAFTPFHKLLFSNNGATSTVASISIELIPKALQKSTDGTSTSIRITPACFQGLSLPRRLERNESIEVDIDRNDFRRIARAQKDLTVVGLVLVTASGKRIRFDSPQILELFDD